MNPSDLTELTVQWHVAQRLHPAYSALAREFVIELEPCADLESGTDTPPRESVEQAANWLREMDERIQIHQLRQFLQTSPLATPEVLGTMLTHLLQKTEKSPSDRDKIDFLLVQFFSQAAPSRLEDAQVTDEYVARLLAPVVGPVDGAKPEWLKPVETVLLSARKVRTLDELLHSGVLEQGRRLKIQSGENYFLPVAMVTFTRFSFLMRRRFFHLMHEDLNVIFDGLRELEAKGIQTIDCRRAQFSAEEPILRLRMICQSWKVMFQAEYSSGQPLRMLVDLRAAVDDALGRGATATPPAAAAAAPAKPAFKVTAAAAASKKGPAPAAAKAPMAARAAAATPAAAKNPAASTAKPTAGRAPVAGAPKFNVPADDTPEFEVSTGDWNPDSSGNQ
jgi:hypothetical protein